MESKHVCNGPHVAGLHLAGANISSPKYSVNVEVMASVMET